MKSLAIAIICVFALVTYAQEITPPFDGHHWEAPYHLPIPQDWTIERFLIPISFAPQIPYKGVEDIRFTPGWGKATSDEYWSYAFLWHLEGNVKIDSRIIESNLQSYYTGLIAVNSSNGQDSPRPSPKANGRRRPAPSLLKKRGGNPLMSVSTSFRKVKRAKGDLETYIGTISMMDYMQQKPIILNCKAHVKSCAGEDHTFIFFQLSPQPLPHHIWESLDQLWSNFRCEKR